MNFKTKIVLLFIIISAGLISQPLSETDRKILEFQDTRDTTRLNDKVKFQTAGSAIRLLYAYANIADSNQSSQIRLINEVWDSNEEVKEIAAFALGQIPSMENAEYLQLMESKVKQEYSFSRTKLIIQIINSLGKIGSISDLERLCKYNFENDLINGALALSIARFGIRKIKSPSAMEKLKELTFSIKDEDNLKWVAYAFNRTGDKDALAAAQRELQFLTGLKNVYSRMWAYSALGKTGNADYSSFIMKNYPDEDDWRVRVNMLNAVGNLDNTEGSLGENDFEKVMHSSVDDVNPNVRIAACQLAAKICSKFGKSHAYSLKLREYFEHYLAQGRAVDGVTQNEMIITLAKIFKDDYRESLFSLFSQAEGYDRKSTIVSAFQYMDDPLVHKQLRDSISADVMRYNIVHPNKDGSMIGSPDLAKMYRAFVETLSVLDDKMDEENRNIMRLIYSEFSASRNTAITDICLSSLTDSMYSKYWDETGQVMLFDFESFNEKTDKDVMILFIEAWGKMKTAIAKDVLIRKVRSADYDIAKASADALKQITGRDYIKDIIAQRFRTDFDWAFIDNLQSKKIAEINTEKGKITIELFPEIAPFTVQSFVKLSENGFYNGTVFHRVVPNFVIQGGDPTGTGYGGPGYSIRTEIADNTFDSYFVGMASSGKDTEGSQFFITHSPQPHLDWKYTIFGKVISGFDVVDKIQVGDKINNVMFGLK